MLHCLTDHSSFCLNSNLTLIFLSRDGLEFVEINKEKQNLDAAPPNIPQFTELQQVLMSQRLQGKNQRKSSCRGGGGGRRRRGRREEKDGDMSDNTSPNTRGVRGASSSK